MTKLNAVSENVVATGQSSDENNNGESVDENSASSKQWHGKNTRKFQRFGSVTAISSE